MINRSLHTARVFPIAIMAFALVGFLFVLDYSIGGGKWPWSITTNNMNSSVACTMEAKLCPDGSSVGRTRPNCEFMPCPNIHTNVIENTNVATNTSTGTILRTCDVDADCSLDLCSGCFNAASYLQYIQHGGAVLACMIYNGDSCTCQQHACVVSQKILHITLNDKNTGTAIANTAIEVYADNGVRCVTAPCPTNGRTWNGRSDNRGSINIPAQYVDESMTVTAGGYQGAELHTSGKMQTDGSWILSVSSK